MISLILVFFYPSLSCQYAHIAQFQINHKCTKKWHESSITKRKKTWLKLWASKKNVSPSESELIKDFISIWWRSREKYFLLNPFSVLKAKYEAKAFKGHAKIIYVEGDTAILWLYQITGDGINKAKLVGYFSVARKWETSADLKLSWEENQYIFKFYCSFFSFCSGREHWKLCIAKQPHAWISAAGISCPSFSDHIEATREWALCSASPFGYVPSVAWGWGSCRNNLSYGQWSMGRAWGRGI